MARGIENPKDMKYEIVPIIVVFFAGQGVSLEIVVQEVGPVYLMPSNLLNASFKKKGDGWILSRALKKISIHFGGAFIVAILLGRQKNLIVDDEGRCAGGIGGAEIMDDVPPNILCAGKKAPGP